MHASEDCAERQAGEDVSVVTLTRVECLTFQLHHVKRTSTRKHASTLQITGRTWIIQSKGWTRHKNHGINTIIYMVGGLTQHINKVTLCSVRLG